MKDTTIKFFINGTRFTSHPIYADTISIGVERDGENMYRRTTINGTIHFVGEYYNWIHNADLDTEFKIEVMDNDTSTTLATGYFHKTDCTFDDDNKTCDVRVTSSDKYSKVLSGLDNEYNLIELAPERESIDLTKRAVLQIYVFRDTKVTNVIGNMSYEIDVANGLNEDVNLATKLTNTYHFKLIHSAPTRVDVSNMPSYLSFLEGTYEGTNDVEHSATNLVRTDGLYRIINKADAHNRWYEFVDANGASVTYHGGAITSKRQKASDFYLYYLTGEHTFQYIDSDAREIVYLTDAKIYGRHLNVYARILLDNQDPNNPLGEIYKINATDDLVPNNLNYRYVMEANITDLDKMVVFSEETTDTPTKWGISNEEGRYFVQPEPKERGDNVIPIGWSMWIPQSYWLNSSVGLSDILDRFSESWTLNDAFPLGSAIKVLLKKIDPSIYFEESVECSEFLYGNPMGVVDHVRQRLFVTPITNVKKTYYDKAARKGTMTLGNILNMLRDAYQCYWFIDRSGFLRIEHISWFRGGGHYGSQTPIEDLTLLKSPMGMKPWDYNINTFSYDKNELIKRYEFKWANDVSAVFDGLPIDINNKYVGWEARTKSVAIANFITDVDLIMSSPDGLSDDIFALIGTGDDNRCPIASLDNLGMNFVCPTYKAQNGYLSFFFLELAYWVYNLSGNLATTENYKDSNGNDAPILVQGISRAMRQQNVSFPILAQDVGKEGLIRTKLGLGEWIKSTYVPHSGIVTMELALPTKSYVVPPKYSLGVTPHLAILLGMGGTAEFTISHSYEWGYVIEENNGISCTKSDNKLVVTASRNTTGSARISKVRVIMGNLEEMLMISQLP